MLVLFLLLLTAPLHAQRAPLPELDALASDPSGTLILFYPENWGLQHGDDQLTLTSNNTPQINISAQVIRLQAMDFEALADWLIQEQRVSPQAQFTAERYGGFDAWLAQGRSLFERSIFSAVVILPLDDGRGVLIRSDFPNESLSEAAPIITAILQHLIILPTSVVTEDDTLEMHLPQTWLHSDGTATFLAAPTEDDLARLLAAETPQGLGVTIRFVQGESAEDVLNSPTAFVQDQSEFRVDDSASTIQLQLDNTSQATEMVLLRQRSADTFIELRASSTDAKALLAQTPLLQALFASVRLR